MRRLPLLLPLVFSIGCITVQVLCPCDRAHPRPHAAHDPPQPQGGPVGMLDERSVQVRREATGLPEIAYDLDAIAFDPGLRRADADILVVFELDGDEVPAAWYIDKAVAEQALRLLEELVLRIPANQRADLVQVEFTRSTDPVGSTDNSGTGSSTGRLGRVMRFSVANFERDPGRATAPLSRRRGTYDWTLVHEFAHLRNYPGDVTDNYIRAFGGPTGSGEGYPEDGSPRTDGRWVTSYAERAGGDEDCAESFTAYVMLDELPTGDSLAARKVRYFDALPGYPELRRRLRCTEPDGSLEPLEPAPVLRYPLEVRPMDWMLGSWRGRAGDGSEVAYGITADDIVRTLTRPGGAPERISYRDLRDTHPLSTVDLYESSDDFYLNQVSLNGQSSSESFRKTEAGLDVDHERLGSFQLVRDAP